MPRPGETHEEMIARLREEQIAKLKADRAKFMKEQEEKQEAELKAKREAEEARLEALRKPVARVWRVARMLMWDAPYTFDELRPAGFWINEQREDGGWTAHGDYVLPHVREAFLFGDGPANVEVVYPGMLSRPYTSEAVERDPEDHPVLIGGVRFYCTEVDKGEDHVNRWRRVLSALGVQNEPPVSPLDPPMTVREIEDLINDSDNETVSRLKEVLPAVRRLQYLHGPVTDQEIEEVKIEVDVDKALDQVEKLDERLKESTRSDKIKDSVKSFEGKRTKDGRPYVRPLRKQAEMPDITTKERDEAYREVK